MSSKSPLDSKLTASYATFLAERPEDADEDVHMLSAVVDHVIEKCSKPDDLVLDLFAGFGTTLARATALERRAVGVELLPERVELIRSRVPDALIIEGDARDTSQIIRDLEDCPPESQFRLILTSPPYMTVNNHEADPLTAYEENDGDYSRYLAGLSIVAAQCAALVERGGYVVWNVADIYHMEKTTHLIRDCSRVLKQYLTPVGITEIFWDKYPHDLVRDALLVFQRTA
ncbi:MAG TPA: DNA methyltransferase [Microbacteriaceae bacterium]|nr:DNA methyltransferase [Microbacteriaceae bacterium]